MGARNFFFLFNLKACQKNILTVEGMKIAFANISLNVFKDRDTFIEVI